MNDKQAGSKFQEVSPVQRQAKEDKNEEKGEFSAAYKIEKIVSEQNWMVWQSTQKNRSAGAQKQKDLSEIMSLEGHGRVLESDNCRLAGRTSWLYMGNRSEMEEGLLYLSDV